MDFRVSMDKIFAYVNKKTPEILAEINSKDGNLKTSVELNPLSDSGTMARAFNYHRCVDWVPICSAFQSDTCSQYYQKGQPEYKLEVGKPAQWAHETTRSLSRGYDRTNTCSLPPNKSGYLQGLLNDPNRNVARTDEDHLVISEVSSDRFSTRRALMYYNIKKNTFRFQYEVEVPDLDHPLITSTLDHIKGHLNLVVDDSYDNIVCVPSFMHPKQEETSNRGWGDVPAKKYIFATREGRLGRVLTEMELDQAIIKKLCTDVNTKGVKYSLRLTDYYIPEIYRHINEEKDLDSCMSHNSSFYDLDGAGPNGEDLHPVMAYEKTPDVCLALLCKGEDDYVARAIMSRKSGKILCTYGQENSRDIMKALGACGRDDSALDGHRLEKVYLKGGSQFVMPYVDSCGNTCEDYGDHLKIEDGGLEANYSTGRPYGGFYCACCGDRTNEDYLREVHDGGLVCNSCIDYEYHSVDGEWYPESDTVWDDYDDCYRLDSHDMEQCDQSGWNTCSSNLVDVEHKNADGERHTARVIKQYEDRWLMKMDELYGTYEESEDEEVA